MDVFLPERCAGLSCATGLALSPLAWQHFFPHSRCVCECLSDSSHFPHARFPHDSRPPVPEPRLSVWGLEFECSSPINAHIKGQQQFRPYCGLMRLTPALTGTCIRCLSGLCDLNPSVYNETWSSKPLPLGGHQNTTPLFILPVPSEPRLTGGGMHRSWEHLLVKQRHPKQTMTLCPLRRNTQPHAVGTHSDHSATERARAQWAHTATTEPLREPCPVGTHSHHSAVKRGGQCCKGVTSQPQKLL